MDLPDTYCHSCTTPYIRSMRSTGNQVLASNHGSIFLYFEFSFLCIHCFMQYTPKLLKLFYSVALFIPQEYTPTPLLSNLSTMALTKTLKPSKTTTSIIKTRSQSRTGTTGTGTTTRTGTNVAVVNPVAAADAAGRTTPLKNPPPVPTGLKPAPRVCNMDPIRTTTRTRSLLQSLPRDVLRRSSLLRLFASLASLVLIRLMILWIPWLISMLVMPLELLLPV